MVLLFPVFESTYNPVCIWSNEHKCLIYEHRILFYDPFTELSAFKRNYFKILEPYQLLKYLSLIIWIERNDFLMVVFFNLDLRRQNKYYTLCMRNIKLSAWHNKININNNTSSRLMEDEDLKLLIIILKYNCIIIRWLTISYSNHHNN